MSNEIVNVAVEYEIDGTKVKLTPSIVQEYIVGSDSGKITMQEFKFFTELCKVRKLNPFLKEAYLIKYGQQPAQIVVGKDAILKRAISHPKFNGREQGIIVLGKNDKIIERKGTFKLANEVLVGGWAKVYRKDWEHPTYISVSFDEVKQEKNMYEDKKIVGKELNSNWKTKGATMVEKVALVRALRETFTEDLAGMVDADEVWDNEPRKAQSPVTTQKDALADVKSKVIDVEPEQLSDLGSFDNLSLDDIE